jgi:HAD superfamily hydrolase (TIGR01509 family)
MSIVICGSTGIVGRHLAVMTPSAVTPSRSDIDYTSRESIRVFFEKYQVKACINCIAERRLEKCEENWNLTKQVNIDIPSNISAVCKSLGVHFVHISTDYVFDGSNPPYSPYSKPCPIQNYGISKFVAELSIHQDSTIIRVPVLYSEYGNDAIEPIIKKVLNTVEESFEDDYFPRRPVYAPDLCNFIMHLVDTKQLGTFHFWNHFDTVTKYQMSRVIGNILGKDVSHVKRSLNTYSAGRPFDTNFTDDSHDIRKFSITCIEDGLKKCLESVYHPGCNDDVFYLFDLDGTLTDTDTSHYNAYKKAGLKMDWSEFEQAINTEKFYAPDEMRTLKNIFMRDEIVRFLPGAEEFLMNVKNHVIVTNSSKEVVESYKKQLPILNKLNIITREEYDNPKPSPDGYALGIKRFYNNEKYIVGFENTIIGYQSIKHFTQCVYLVTNTESYCYKQLKNEKVHFIKDYLKIVLH